MNNNRQKNKDQTVSKVTKNKIKKQCIYRKYTNTNTNNIVTPNILISFKKIRLEETKVLQVEYVLRCTSKVTNN